MPRKKAEKDQNKKTKKNSNASIKNLITSKIINLKNFPAKINKKITITILGFLILVAVSYLIVRWGLVALVDKSPITKLQILKTLDEKYGEQIKEQLIVEQLVLNEAKRRNVNITGAEIDTEIKKVQDQLGGQEVFSSWLMQQGLTLEEFKKDRKLNLLVFKMFENSVKVSEDEVNKFLEENKEQLAASLNQSTPNEEALKKAALEQVKNQKVAEEIRNWISQARKTKVVEF